MFFVDLNNGFLENHASIFKDYLIMKWKNNLIKFGQSIYAKKGSFVVVSKISFEENLNIVPTMQEAFDFVEMEEIERQLDF